VDALEGVAAVIDLDRLAKEDRARRVAALRKPPPIPCLGSWTDTTNGRDFDCDYPHAGKIGCESCIVNGGPMDPRTGKRARSRGWTP